MQKRFLNLLTMFLVAILILQPIMSVFAQSVDANQQTVKEFEEIAEINEIDQIEQSDENTSDEPDLPDQSDDIDTNKDVIKDDINIDGYYNGADNDDIDIDGNYNGVDNDDIEISLEESIEKMIPFTGVFDRAKQLREQPRRHPDLTVEEALLTDYLNDDLQYLVHGDYTGDLYYDGLPFKLPERTERLMRPEEEAVAIKGLHPDLNTGILTLDFLGDAHTRNATTAITGFRRHPGFSVSNANTHMYGVYWFEIRLGNTWHTAFCINFLTPGPVGQGQLQGVGPYNNAQARRALWFGYGGGSGHWARGVGGTGNTLANRRYLATTIVLTYISTGWYTGNGRYERSSPANSLWPEVRELWRRVDGSTELPNHNFDITRGDNRTATLTTSVRDGVQRSQNVRIRGWNQNQFRIPVPKGVDLINESRSGGTVRNGGTAVVRGGETIRFEAPLSSNVNVDSGRVTGSVKEFAPMRITTPSGVQNLSMGLHTDPTGWIRLRVNFTPQNNEISIRKENAINGAALARAEFRIRRENSSGDWSNANYVTWVGGSTPNNNQGDARPNAWRRTPSNGTLRITGLVPGRKYEICEMTPPSGFVLNGGQIINGNTGNSSGGRNGNCFTFTSSSRGGVTEAPRIFRNQPIRTVNANHINTNNTSHVLGTNTVTPPSGVAHWLDGMKINNRSHVRTFAHSPTGRNWRHDSVTGNNATINGNMTVTHRYTRPVNIEVRHINSETGQIVRREQVRNRFTGDSVRYCPVDDLMTDDTSGYLLVSNPDSVDCIDRVLPDNDNLSVFEFFYTPPPKLDINVNQVEITTGQTNMEANLTLAMTTIRPDHLGEIDYRVVLKNESTDDITATDWRSWENFISDEKVKLSTLGMALGEAANIRVTVEFKQPDNSPITVTETETINLLTRGYKSSEQVLTNVDLQNGRMSYTAPARTTVRRDGSSFGTVEVLDETVSFEFTPMQRTHTGYGVDTPFNLRFVSEINDRADEISMELETIETLADNYISEEFDITSGLMRTELERTSRDAVDDQTTEYKFEFQNVYVQKAGRTGDHDFINGGEVFSDRQVQDGHKALINEVRDGYRRFYIPIWHDLGIFEFNYESTEIGRNLITIDMTQEIDVFAYMYAWIGSPTVDDDALLMQPIFPCTQTPDEWSADEISWLRSICE